MAGGGSERKIASAAGSIPASVYVFIVGFMLLCRIKSRRHSWRRAAQRQEHLERHPERVKIDAEALHAGNSTCKDAIRRTEFLRC
jgi:hypothetical protein